MHTPIHVTLHRTPGRELNQRYNIVLPCVHLATALMPPIVSTANWNVCNIDSSLPGYIRVQKDQTAKPGERRTAKPRSPQDRTAELVYMPGATNIYFWQVIGLETGNRVQEAGWMITRVAQRNTQPAIIHPDWLAY